MLNRIPGRLVRPTHETRGFDVFGPPMALGRRSPMGMPSRPLEPGMVKDRLKAGAFGRAILATLTASAAADLFSSLLAKLAGGQTLTGGFAATSYNAGTKSSGTYTPDPASGNFQHATNGGAHTLAPPTNVCSIVLEYLNNGSAGAITTSGFTKVTGDSFTTTNGSKFACFILKTNSYSHLHVQALQ